MNLLLSILVAVIAVFTPKDTTYYSSFPDAFAKTRNCNHAVIQLQSDVDFGGVAATHYVQNSLTIDLNGYSLGDTISGWALLQTSQDTAHLTVTSSRPGGRIWAVRDFNGKFSALSAYKGAMTLSHIRVEAKNLGTYDPESYPNLAVGGVTASATTSLTMDDCYVSTEAENIPSALSNGGGTGPSPKVHVTNCHFVSRGKTKVYGIATHNNSVIENTTVEIEASDSIAYAIHVNKSTDTVPDSEKETLLRNVHIYSKTWSKGYGVVVHSRVNMQRCSVECTVDSSYTVGVSMGAQAIADLSDCLVQIRSNGSGTGIYSGCDSISSGQVTLKNTRFDIQGSGTTLAINCYNTLLVENCRIDVSATDLNAYGIQVNNVNNYLPDLKQETFIRHTRINTKAPGNAYGLIARAPLQMIEDTIVAQVVDSLPAYGIVCSSQADVEKCYVEVHSDSVTVYGVVVQPGGTANLSNNYIRATSAKATAVGIHSTRNEGQQPALAILRNNRVESQGNKSTYGINVYGDALIDSCQVEVKTNDQFAYGIHVHNNYADTIPNEDDFSIVRHTRAYASSRKHAYGLFSRASVMASECTLIAETDSAQAYGVYGFGGRAEIKACDLVGKSRIAQAYGVGLAESCTHGHLQDCQMKVSARTEYAAVRYYSSLKMNLAIEGGYYTDDNNLRLFIPDTCSVYRIWPNEAKYNEGYRYTVQSTAHPNAVIACIYDDPADQMPSHSFHSITEGLDYISQHADEPLTLMVVGGCILPKGEYRVPKKHSLVIAYNDAQTRAIGTQAARQSLWVWPAEYARLKMEDGASLQVEGTLEVSALQKAGYNGSGGVVGKYGIIELAPTAHINLLEGARMQAWGCVVGEGLVEVQAGASIHEELPMGDWKGVKLTFAIKENKQRVFPITHYFYQNVEARVLYHSGATALGSIAETFDDIRMEFDGIRLIANDSALFVMDKNDPNATILKRYDPLTDRLEWTMNGNVALNELTIVFNGGVFGQFEMCSSHYILPLTTNTTITARSGNLTMLNDVVMLPGAEVYVEPEAKITIPDNVNVYLYDTAEWKAFNDKKYSTIYWSPSWEECPRDSVLKPALVRVGGEIDVQGAMWATEGGAAVIGSTESEGIVRIAKVQQKPDTLYQLIGNVPDYAFASAIVHSVPLRNADFSIVPTDRKGEYTYLGTKWQAPDDDAIHTPGSENKARKIIDPSGCYIITPDGKTYTVLGQQQNH